MYNGSKLIYLDQCRLSDYGKCMCGYETHKKYKTVSTKISSKTDDGSWIIPINTTQIIESIQYNETPDKEGSPKKTNNHILILLKKSRLQLLDFAHTCRTEIYCVLNDKPITTNRFLLPYTTMPVPLSNLEISIKNKTDNLKKDQEYLDMFYGFLDTFAWSLIYNNDFDEFSKLFKDMDSNEFDKHFDSLKESIKKVRESMASLFTEVEYLEELKKLYLKCKKEKGKSFADKIFTLEAFLTTCQQINRLLARHSKTVEIPDSILSDEDKLYEFSMKNHSFKVYITLILHLYQNERGKIDKNDLKDILFLSVAVPYCDIIITEKKWANVICDKKMDVLFGTKVSNDLNLLLNED